MWQGAVAVWLFVDVILINYEGSILVAGESGNSE